MHKTLISLHSTQWSKPEGLLHGPAYTFTGLLHSYTSTRIYIMEKN